MVDKIFGAKKQNRFFSKFDGADSKYAISYYWLAPFFTVL